VLAFELLDLTIEKMQANNLVIVFNKAEEGEDNLNSVLKFYAEAFEQAKCDHMPKPNELDSKNVLLLFKQKMGPKDRPMEECVKEATALFHYTQNTVI
jgi:hypothetical protein